MGRKPIHRGEPLPSAGATVVSTCDIQADGIVEKSRR